MLPLSGDLVMEKKHRYLITVITILTLIHMVFCTFYPRIYGYFNTQDLLPSFLTVLLVIRVLFFAGVAFCGFLAIKDRSNKVLPFYLILFFFNLIIPAIFR